MVKTRSLSHLGLIRYRVVTDRRTDRITIASTRLALPAVAHKNELCALNTKLDIVNIVAHSLHL